MHTSNGFLQTQISHAVWVANNTQPNPGPSSDLAPFSVQITQPMEGLDTTNRYYKQYTGIEYNVKIYTHGGNYSTLIYSLDTAPSGMVANPVTGEVSWPNPVNGVHNVTFRVSDGTTFDTASITLTVDTNDALFVDSVNGNPANPGAIGSPLSDITDWYGATKSNSDHAGKFVYYREGTYNVDCIPKNEPSGGVTLSQSKPTVHLAYPGETAVLDCGVGFWFCDVQVADMCFDAFDIVNVGAKPEIGRPGDEDPASGEGVWFSRLAGARHIYRRCRFLSINESDGSNNQAYIMAPFSGCTDWGISENSFDGQNQECYALGIFYKTTRAIVERNTIVNCIGIGIGMKRGNNSHAIRGNYVQGSGRLISNAMEPDEYALEGNFEVSWNFVNGPDPVEHNYGTTGAGTDCYYIRNTILGPFYIREWNTAGFGDIYLTDNVVVSPTDVLYTTEGIVDASKVIESGNLVNTTTTDFVDPATGLLIGGYAGQNSDKGFNGFAEVA